MPEQEVVQAVVVARNEQRHALSVARVGESIAHREAPGDLGNRALERQAIRLQLRQIEAQALKEHPQDGVRVLIGVEDVRTVAVEHLRQSSHDAAAIRARDE